MVGEIVAALRENDFETIEVSVATPAGRRCRASSRESYPRLDGCARETPANRRDPMTWDDRTNLVILIQARQQLHHELHRGDLNRRTKKRDGQEPSRLLR